MLKNKKYFINKNGDTIIRVDTPSIITKVVFYNNDIDFNFQYTRNDISYKDYIAIQKNFTETTESQFNDLLKKTFIALGDKYSLVASRHFKINTTTQN